MANLEYTCVSKDGRMTTLPLMDSPLLYTQLRRVDCKAWSKSKRRRAS